MASAAKKVRVSVATTAGGVYTPVAGQDSASMNRNGQNVDVTTLTDNDIVRLQGIRDCSYDIAGNYEIDANGQGAIRSAYDNDTALFARFSVDGGITGWQQEVKVSKYSIDGQVKGKVGVSITLEGSAAITTF